MGLLVFLDAEDILGPLQVKSHIAGVRTIIFDQHLYKASCANARPFDPARVSRLGET